MEKVFIGPKLRQLRHAHNQTQADLAKRIGVSAAYVNLLENNQRSLTVKMLMSLTEIYCLQAQALAKTAETDELASLRLMGRDPMFTDTEPDLTQLRAALTHAPQFVDRFKHLYQDYQRLAEYLQQNLPDDGTAAGQSKGEMGIYEFFKRNRNYFPKLETIAKEIREKLATTQDDLYFAIKTYLTDHHGVKTEVLKLSHKTHNLMNYDDAEKIVHLSEGLDAPNRTFQLAYVVAQIEATQDLLAYDIKQSDTKERLTNELLNYIAAAILMPYDEIWTLAKKTNYDIDRIAAGFGVTFEQAAQRLTTLQASGKQGIPLFFIRLDRAGNITKRINPINAALADLGGRCAVWNIHSAYQNPDVVTTQMVELADGTRYATLARTTHRSVYSRKTQDRRMIVVLGCDINFAKDITYFDSANAASDYKTTPIGLSCQTCALQKCAQRAHHPVHVRLSFDPHRRGATRYEN